MAAIQDPIKRKKLYDYLSENDMTDLSFDDFSNEYGSNIEKQSNLYSYLKSNNLTDLDSESFASEYFGDLKKKEVSDSSSPSTLQNEELVSGTTDGSLGISEDRPTYNLEDKYRLSPEEWLEAQERGFAPPPSVEISLSRPKMDSSPEDYMNQSWEERQGSYTPFKESFVKSDNLIEKVGTGWKPETNEEKSEFSRIKSLDFQMKDLNIQHPYKYFSEANKSNYNDRDEFIENNFGYDNLISMGIDPVDFDGFINKKGYKEDFSDKESRGLFESSDYSFDHNLAQEQERYRMLSLYIADMNKRAVLREKLNAEIESGTPADMPDPVFIFNEEEVSNFIKNEFPIYSKVVEERKEKEKEILKKHIDGEAGFWFRVGGMVNRGWDMFAGRINDISATTYDKIGFDTIADEIRYSKSQSELAKPNDRLVSYVSGKSGEHNGRQYLVDNKGRVIDSELKIDVTDVLDSFTYKDLMSKSKDWEDDWTLSGWGMATETAGVATDLIVQIAATAALSRIGIKPLASSMIAQGALGYSQGLEDGMNSAREYGLTESESAEFASSLAREMGTWYVLTSVISPQTKGADAMFGISKKKFMEDAVKAYSRTDKKALGRFVDNVAENYLSKRGIRNLAVDFNIEGAKEAIQENIQQLGEVNIKQRANRISGQEILEAEDMTGDDIFNTTIISYIVGGIPSMLKFSSNRTTDKLLLLKSVNDSNVDVVGVLDNLEKEEVITNEFRREFEQDLKAYRNNINKIPDNLDSEIALEVLNSLERINELETKKESLDSAFHSEVDEEIKSEREKISDLTKRVKKEASKSESTTDTEVETEPSSSQSTALDSSETTTAQKPETEEEISETEIEEEISETETDRDLEEVIGVSPDEVTDFDNVLVEEQKKLSELESKHGANHRLVKEQRAVVDALEKNAPISVSVENGKIVVKGRGSDNQKTRKEAIQKAIDEGVIDEIPPTNMEGANYGDVDKIVARESHNPIEVATSLDNVRKEEKSKGRTVRTLETARDAVLDYFASGGKISTNILQQLFGNKRGKNIQGEIQARLTLLSNSGPVTVDGLADQIWNLVGEELGITDSSEIREEIEDVLLSFETPKQMREELYGLDGKTPLEVELEMKFEELTGLKPNQSNIEMFFKRNREEDSNSNQDPLDDIPFQSTKETFKPISRRKLNQLVRGLQRAFKKAGKKVRVHTGAKKMADRLKQLAERGYNTPSMQIDGKSKNEGQYTPIRLLQTKDGTVYGFVDPVTGDIYMDGDLMNANTPIHEFAHLWISSIQQSNPKLWERMVNVAKQTPEWNRLANDPNYKAQFKGKKGKALDNAIADEVWATIIGNHGENNFESVLEKMNGDRTLAQKVWDAAQDFWQAVVDLLYDAGVFSGDVTLPNGVRLQASVFHGSPHAFDRFSTDYIGTGEGAQAFGWGLYFTDLESIASSYAKMGTKITVDGKEIYSNNRSMLYSLGVIPVEQDLAYNSLIANFGNVDMAIKTLMERGNTELINNAISILNNSNIEVSGDRNLYSVTLHKGKTPDQYTWLEWDKKFSELPQNTREALLKLQEVDKIHGTAVNLEVKDYTIEHFYKMLSLSLGSPQAASLFLLENGIDGIKYPAESISRGATSDNARGFNYVVFDENAVTIEEHTRFQQGNQNTSDQSLQNPEVAAIADMALGQMMSGEFGTSDPAMDFAMQYASESELLRDDNGNVIGVKPEVLEEIRKEREQIETEARANGTWMKAPNGENTNLNEDQWVTVRTIRFKEWFGDWESLEKNTIFDKNKSDHDQRTAIYNQLEGVLGKRGTQETQIGKPETIDGRGKQRTSGLSPQALRQKIAEHAKRTGKYIDNIQSLSKSQFPSGHESEVYESKDTKTVLKVNRLPFLNDNFSFNDWVEKIIAHNVVFPEVAYTIIGVTENSNGEVSVVLEQPAINVDTKNPATQQEIDAELTRLGFVEKKDGSSTYWTNGVFNVSDVLPKNVLKDKDGDLYFIDGYVVRTPVNSDNISKVVDENEEPLVVYHGTSGVFNEFKPFFRLPNQQGYFFFESKSEAEKWGQNGQVVAAFLNVTNPLTVDYGKEMYQVEKVDNLFKQLQYEDGIIIENIKDRIVLTNQYITLSPNQIKSATGNVGTFSNETGDIRFQKESSKDLSKTEQTRAEKFLDLLDSWESEIDKFGKETMGVNIPVVVAKGMIRMMRIAVKGGMNITQAFNAGMDYIRETDWYKKLSETDKAKVEAKTFRTVITNAVRQAIDAENKLNKIREKLNELTKETEVEKPKTKDKRVERAEKEKRVRQEVVNDLVHFLSKNKIDGKITPTEVNRLIKYASRIATDSNAQKAFDRFLDAFNKVEINAARRANSRNTEEIHRIDVTSKVDEMLNAGMNESDIINSFETKWQRDVAFDHIERQRDITDEEASKEWDLISEDYYNKFRDKKPLKKRAKKWVNAVRKALFSSQIHAEDLTEKSGLRRTRNLLRNFHGAKGLAKTVFDDAYAKIWGVEGGRKGHWALNKKLRHALDDMIFHRRVIELENDYIAKGKEPVMHTGGWNKKKAEAKLREMKKELGEKTFNDLMRRSDIYFDTFKRLLKDKYDAGLISKESYDSMKDLNYSPRMLASILLDFDGDLTERGKNNRSNRNGKTDAEIRSMGEGSLEHFFKESEWLLATALNSGYRNIAQNRLNNMLFREMEVQKERFEKIDAKVKAGEKLRRSETEFYDAYKELSEKIIENPIIGFTKDGNPKYQRSNPPSHNFVQSYRWVDGVRHSFFVESKLAEEWFANREGFLHPKSKWWISMLSGSALVKYFATGNNPAFFISNTPRDILYNYTFSDEFSPISVVGAAQMLKESATASVDIIKHDFNLGDNLLETLYDYGLSMEFLSTQGRIKSNLLLDLFPKNQRDNFQFVWRNLTLQQMQTANELMFRVGLAQRTIVNFLKQNGIKDVNQITENLAKEKGYENKQDMVDDMYETAVSQARGILDFSRGGWLSKDLEAFIPYTNVALQSTGKLLEKLHRNPVETTVKMAQVMGIMSTLPIMASIMYIALRYNPDDEDEEQDGKWKSAFKVYFETMDGLSKYERTNYAHIPLGIKDENGNWMAIRIAKEHALTAPLAVSDYYTQNFVRKLAGVKEESSAGLQGRLGFALRKNYAASITPQDFITDIPITRTLEVQRTGYDSFRDQFLPGTKGSIKYGIHSLQGEGLTNPNVEEFWKAMGEQFYISPIRTKYAVESIITSPSTNPMIGLLYGGADVVWSGDKTMSEVREDLIDNISKSPFKRVIVSSSDYNRGYAEREAREKEDDKFRYKLQKRNKKENELIEKRMNNEISMEEFLKEAKKIRPEDPKKVSEKLKKRIKDKNVSWEMLNLRSYSLEERARAIWEDYGDIRSESNKEIRNEMRKAGGILTENFWKYYRKEKNERLGEEN